MNGEAIPRRGEVWWVSTDKRQLPKPSVAVVSDAKQLMADVARMVEKQKQQRE